jgi:TonB family protein
MNAEPGQLASGAWTKWQGQVVGGAFRLRRYLGSSDHSAVFLAECAAPHPEVALKLVPATPGLAESLLSDWKAAVGLSNPHLIRLLATGHCQLGDRPHVYAVMEYADQNLGQLLRQRALTEHEARDILAPTLSALAYLHARNLVQGQLKPANLLAVGDRLKLASDTVRRVSSGDARRDTLTIYDPPEARDGIYSPAGDVWALGVSLFEALTRSAPLGLDERRGGVVVVPHNFSPAFREIVAWCLSRRPQDRPGVKEIEAWMRRQSPGAVPIAAPHATAPAPAVTPVPGRPRAAEVERAVPVSETLTSRIARAAGARPATHGPAASGASGRRSLAPVILGALAVLALSWIGMRLLGTHRSSALPAAHTPAERTVGALSAPPAKQPPAQSVPAATAINPIPEKTAGTPPAVVREDIPDVPRSARRTIHGHVRVSVRVIVDKAGTVSAAMVDQPGPSRYFERLAIEAAKKWTFAPVDAPARRLKLVRFEFTRDGAQGYAVSLR